MEVPLLFSNETTVIHIEIYAYIIYPLGIGFCHGAWTKISDTATAALHTFSRNVKQNGTFLLTQLAEIQEIIVSLQW